VNILIDIQVGISMVGHSAMDIRKQWISMSGYPCLFIWILVFNHPYFYGYPFGYHWISNGYPYIDLLWILDAGHVKKYYLQRFGRVFTNLFVCKNVTT